MDKASNGFETARAHEIAKDYAKSDIAESSDSYFDNDGCEYRIIPVEIAETYDIDPLAYIAPSEWDSGRSVIKIFSDQGYYVGTISDNSMI